MRIATILMVFFISILVLSATDAIAEDEIYRWVDENGVVHFGDRPGGQAGVEKVDIPESQINSAQPASAAASGDTSQPPSRAQQQRDERAVTRKEAAEKQKELEAGCTQRRQLVTQLEPSTRVMVTYEDGTVIRMDDNDRLEKLNEAKSYIAENCNK
jgi:hypothetical protein